MKKVNLQNKPVKKRSNSTQDENTLGHSKSRIKGKPPSEITFDEGPIPFDPGRHRDLFPTAVNIPDPPNPAN
ncbi:MAG: hypothetical protein ACOYNC_00905 [Bacteroidales bacterium]